MCVLNVYFCVCDDGLAIVYRCVSICVHTKHMHACMHVVDRVLNCSWCGIQLSLDLRECNSFTSRAVSVCLRWFASCGLFLSVRSYPVGVGVRYEIVGLLVKNEWARMWLEVKGLRKVTKLVVLRGLFEFQTRHLWSAGQKSHTWSLVAWNNGDNNLRIVF